MRWGILFVFMFTLAGCGSTLDGPEGVVKNYLKAQCVNDYEQACTYLSSADKNAMTIENGEYDLTEMSLGVTKYEVKECKIEGDKAKVSVTLTLIDIGSLMESAMEEAVANPELAMEIWDDEGQKRLQERMKKKVEDWMEDGKPPTIKKDGTFNLIREENRWKIFLNLKVNPQ